MRNRFTYQQLETAMQNGAFGARLGALFLSPNDSREIAALIGAAMAATYNAFNQSRNSKIGVLYEENGTIYRAFPNGRKEFHKVINRQAVKVPNSFTLA